MDSCNIVKFYLWDASAIIPLFVDEGERSKNVLRLYQSPDNENYITEYTKAEVLNRIKRDFKGKFSTEDYVNTVLRVMLEFKQFKTVEIDSTGVFALEAVSIAQQHNIDVIDAVIICNSDIQLISFGGGGSGPYLVTCDRGMAGAAKTRKFQVIYIE